MPLVLAQAEPADASGNLWLQAVLIVLFVILNAAFAGSETALVSLRDTQVQRLEERGRAGSTLAKLARDPNRFLSTVQIGITLAGFLAASTATQAFAATIERQLEVLGGAAGPVAILLVTVVLTFITIVLGELAPKRIALQRSEGWGLLAARPLSLASKLTAPAVWLLTKSTDLVVRLFGGDPDSAREPVTEEELRDLVAQQASFTSEQRSIISGAFEVAERTLREILVPRTTVLAIAGEAPVRGAIQALVGSGYSRAPVYRGDLDDVLGIVHLRDLVDAEGAVEHCVRPAPVLPETVGVLDALQRLRLERQQMAVVINEHGGTEGIVTIEDLLEEIVGEIYDEFDRDLDPTDVRGVTPNPDGSIDVPGSFPIHDLPDLGVTLAEGPYATVAGFVLAKLGRLPEPGVEVRTEGWRIRVTERERNAIGRLLLIPEPAVDEAAVPAQER